ncbi:MULTISPECIES: hypothetical protein [Niallia]|nr:hypothetical protein [Niallia alba]
METFLEFLREVLKGIVREISAYFFRKNKTYGHSDAPKFVED